MQMNVYQTNTCIPNEYENSSKDLRYQCCCDGNWI